jgi:hypothetical protein
MNVLRETKSLCPECLKTLKATVYEEDGKVWIKKECPEHGEFSDLYWGDSEMYQKVMKTYHEGKGIENPNVSTDNECPMNCGLCKNHKSHTALANVVVTNRCDLQCFYCFFFAKKMGYVYEPTLDQLRMMFKKLREEKPVRANAVQLTGGNPEMREDLLDIIRIAKEEGFEHIQLNINGTHKLAKDLDWANKIRESGVNTIYLSYDGTTAQTNPKNHWEIPNIIDNSRKAKLGLVLVPTVINTVNDHDVGNILDFGIKNIDVVRGINYQPVSLVGRVSKADVKKFRITIPDLIKRLEEHTSGAITKSDWYPIPTVVPITHYFEALTGKPQYELTSHPACGMATYLFMDNGKIKPLPSFFDVDGFTKFLDELAPKAGGIKGKISTSLTLMSKLNSFVDKEKQPKDLKLSKILFNILRHGDYNSLGVLQHKSLFVGSMHFMDLYNYDIERVKNCCIHYAQPDGTIIPFCSFNVIPQVYRDKIQEKFSLPIAEWEKQTGRKLDDDFYKRKQTDNQAL